MGCLMQGLRQGLRQGKAWHLMSDWSCLHISISLQLAVLTLIIQVRSCSSTPHKCIKLFEAQCNSKKP